MTDRELMRQTLEALDYEADRENDDGYRLLRDALRERLSRQETHSEECWRWHHECAVAKIERLAQPAQEQDKFSCGVDFADGLLTVSVVRGQADGIMEVIHCEQIELSAQQPLTDEQIALIVADCSASAHRRDDFSFARAIEAAHGIGEKK